MSSTADQALDLILQEIAFASLSGRDLLDGVFEECDAAMPKTGSFLSPRREVMDRIQRALSHAATISRCMNAPAWKSTKAEQAFHRQRGVTLGKIFVGVDLGPLRSRSVRDSLEHIDEHADRLFAKRPDQTPRTTVIYNMIHGRAADFRGQPAYCRVFTVETRTFHNLGHSIALMPIRNALDAVHQRLLKVAPHFNEGGGSMFV